MAEFGVYRARNSEEMLDIAHTATRKIYPARNTLGVITVSGGAGVLISDVAESVGLAMPEMPMADTEEIARSGAVLRAAQSRGRNRSGVERRNPDQDVYRIHGAGRRLFLGPGFLQHDRVVAPLAGDPRAIECGEIGKPGPALCVSVITPPERRDELEADGWVVHEDPTRAVVAIDAMGRFGDAFAAHAAAGTADRAGGELAGEKPIRGRGETFAGRRRNRVGAGGGMRHGRSRRSPRRNDSVIRS